MDALKVANLVRTAVAAIAAATITETTTIAAVTDVNAESADFIYAQVVEVNRRVGWTWKFDK